MAKGRKLDFTSSSYVTGNVNTKAIDTFVEKGVDKLTDLAAYAKGLDDNKLGLTERAARKVLARVREVINNIEHGRGSRKHGTKNLQKRHSQRKRLEHFYKALKAECDTRETACEDCGDKKAPEYHGATTGRAKTKGNPAVKEKLPAIVRADEEVDKVMAEVDKVNDEIRREKAIYDLVRDLPLVELLEFAAKGVEAGDTAVLNKELEDTRKQLEKTQASLEHQKGRVAAKEQTIRDLRTTISKNAPIVKKARALFSTMIDNA